MKPSLRIAIEQAIARQEPISQIMRDLDVDYDTVKDARQSMLIAAAKEYVGPLVTPGQAALIEAMRFEQARIYGQPCPEYKRPHADLYGPVVHSVPIDLSAARRRRGVA